VESFVIDFVKKGRIKSAFNSQQINDNANGGKMERATKLYIGNLEYETSIEDLKTLFTVFGKVVSAIIVKNDLGQSMGFGFVEMSTPEEAERAAETLDKSMFSGRVLTVNEAKERKPISRENSKTESRYVPGTSKLYVGNLPYSVTSDELEELFSSAGKVLDISMIVDKETKRPKGFAFIEMCDCESAEKAVKIFNEKEIGGRSMSVNSARERR
jgi:nucleolin